MELSSDDDDHMDLDPPDASSSAASFLDLLERERVMTEIDIARDARAKRRRTEVAAQLVAAAGSASLLPTIVPDFSTTVWSARPSGMGANYALHPALAKLLPTRNGVPVAAIYCDLPYGMANLPPLRAAFDHLGGRFGGTDASPPPPPHVFALLIWLLGHSAYGRLALRQNNGGAGADWAQVFEYEAHQPGSDARNDFHPPLGAKQHPPVSRHSVRYRYPYACFIMDTMEENPDCAAGMSESLKLMAALSMFSLFPCPAEFMLPPAVLRRLASLRHGDLGFAARVGAFNGQEPPFNAQSDHWRPNGKEDDLALTEFMSGLNEEELKRRSIDWASVWRPLVETMSAAFESFHSMGPTGEFMASVRPLYETAVDYGDPAHDQDMVLLLGEWDLPGGW